MRVIVKHVLYALWPKYKLIQKILLQYIQNYLYKETVPKLYITTLDTIKAIMKILND
jgi:hypothetical protein